MRVVPDGFHLLDMGSSNGVYVLGQKIEDAIIREGDVFSMGDVFVRILPGDMPATLAMTGNRNDQTLRNIQVSIEPPRRPIVPAPAPPRPEPRPPRVARRPSPVADRVLGVSSMAIGVGLIASALTLGSQLGILSIVLPSLGAASFIAGAGFLFSLGVARALHYMLFALWSVTCLMAPFGVIGFAYQLKGREHPDTDSFFAVVIGFTALLAISSLAVVAYLARIYVKAPLPL